MNKETKCRSIIEWENAINNRVDIEFVEILLTNRTVFNIHGFIIYHGKRRRAKWIFDGRCYYNGRRVSSFDIVF